MVYGTCTAQNWELLIQADENHVTLEHSSLVPHRTRKSSIDQAESFCFRCSDSLYYSQTFGDQLFDGLSLAVLQTAGVSAVSLTIRSTAGPQTRPPAFMVVDPSR